MDWNKVQNVKNLQKKNIEDDYSYVSSHIVECEKFQKENSMMKER